MHHPSQSQQRAADAGPPSVAENFRLAWRFRRYAFPYLFPALGLLLMSLAQADLTITATSAGQRVLDRFVSGPQGAAATAGEGGSTIAISEHLLNALARDAGALALALYMALFLVLAEAVGIWAEQIRTWVNHRFRQGLQQHMVAALARELAATRGQRQTGVTSQIYSGDTNALSSLLIFGIVGALQNIVKLGVYVYGILQLPGGWRILIVVAPLAFFFQTAVSHVFVRREARVNERSERLSMQVRARTVELFDVLSRLVYFRGERAISERLLAMSEEAGRANRRFQLVSSAHNAASSIVAMLSLPLVVILVGKLPGISPGVIVQAQALVMALTTSIATVVGIPAMLGRSSPSMRRVEEVLAVPEVGPEPPQLRPLIAAGEPPSVSFRDVSFGYPGSVGLLLRKVSFDVPSGARVGIVGKSGSGKSTIARIIVGDARPTAGRIVVGGVDVTDWHLWWRRELIGFLPAEQGFLRGTWEENILFGRTRAQARDFEQALRLSGVAAILEERRARGEPGLELELHNVVDQLSSGERRKTGIARLLIGDQRLLIFDEPGSQLDPRGLQEVASALVTATAGRTSLIITHDPDVFITDFNLFLQNGEIADQGPHAELLRRNRAYAERVERNIQERVEEAQGPELAAAAAAAAAGHAAATAHAAGHGGGGGHGSPPGRGAPPGHGHGGHPPAGGHPPPSVTAGKHPRGESHGPRGPHGA